MRGGEGCNALAKRKEPISKRKDPKNPYLRWKGVGETHARSKKPKKKGSESEADLF